MATILGDVQYTHFMGHLPTPAITMAKSSIFSGKIHWNLNITIVLWENTEIPSGYGNYNITIINCLWENSQKKNIDIFLVDSPFLIGKPR